MDLDLRQRAMLEEMHVRVWWPLPSVEEPPSTAAVRDDAAVRTDTPPPPRVAVAPPTPRPAPPAPPSVAVPATLPPAPAVEAGEDGWPGLVRSVAACRACGLCDGRQAPVLRPAAVPAQRDWMVVGEPPNESEEHAGEALTGEAGLLLDNMLRAVGVSRRSDGAQGAWVTNVVKCRPAIARIPQDDELRQCRTHLDAEIALVRPRVILAMGRFATQGLLGADHPALAGRPFGQLRGSVHEHAGVPVVVMVHPERLLRAPALKADAWADLCRAVELARGS